MVSFNLTGKFEVKNSKTSSTYHSNMINITLIGTRKDSKLPVARKAPEYTYVGLKKGTWHSAPNANLPWNNTRMKPISSS